MLTRLGDTCAEHYSRIIGTYASMLAVCMHVYLCTDAISGYQNAPCVGILTRVWNVHEMYPICPCILGVLCVLQVCKHVANLVTIAMLAVCILLLDSHIQYVTCPEYADALVSIPAHACVNTTQNSQYVRVSSVYLVHKSVCYMCVCALFGCDLNVYIMCASLVRIYGSCTLCALWLSSCTTREDSLFTVYHRCYALTHIWPVTHTSAIHGHSGVLDLCQSSGPDLYHFCRPVTHCAHLITTLTHVFTVCCHFPGSKRDTSWHVTVHFGCDFH